MKRLLLLFLIGLFLVSASGCSNAAPAAETDTPETVTEPVPTPEPVQEPAAVVEFTTEGSYKLFGVLYQEMLVDSNELQTESDVTLEEGGTGSMFFDGDSVDITKWELNGDTVSLTLSDGGTADAKTHDGILELDIYGDGSMIMYYAQEGADITGYEFLSLEEVREILNGE